jgi:hypothetical protein
LPELEVTERGRVGEVIPMPTLPLLCCTVNEPGPVIPPAKVEVAEAELATNAEPVTTPDEVRAPARVES